MKIQKEAASPKDISLEQMREEKLRTFILGGRVFGRSSAIAMGGTTITATDLETGETCRFPKETIVRVVDVDIYITEVEEDS